MARSVPARSPERTRERIMRAALVEFSSRGLSGARVDSIARRARVNKRMLYHYFGNKDDLFREILRRKLADRARAREEALADAPLEASSWLLHVTADPDWVRLMQWEALEGRPTVVLEKERRGYLQQAVDRFRREQRAGRLSQSFDPELLLLTLIGLAAAPLALPQLVRLVTGRASTTPEIRERWTMHLATLMDHIREAPRKKAPKQAAS